MQNRTVMALGNNENTFIFSTIGIDNMIVSKENIKSVIKDNVSKDIKIFLVSQYFHKEIKEIKEEYQDRVYPIFLLLSMDENENSRVLEDLRTMVENATGISLI